MTTAITFESLLVAARSIASDVAAAHADDVDARARFPQETVDALRAARLLSAPVPRELGGAGCSMLELGLLCSTLSQACGASGMVLAMHYIEVACIARHGMTSPFFRAYMRSLCERQWLIASVTSEVGTFGDTRSSVCAVEVSGERFKLVKDATTVSYGQHADALLVTARRAPDAASGDQVLVLLRTGEYTLAQTGNWDTLGMRGTCSPGAKLSAEAGIEQILPGAFAESSSQTMVPYSHILWSSLWWGIAADAVGRAAAFVRGQARKQPGTVPPAAHQLAHAHAELQTMRNGWAAAASHLPACASGTTSYSIAPTPEAGGAPSSASTVAVTADRYQPCSPSGPAGTSAASTAGAFASATPHSPAHATPAVVSRPPSTWCRKFASV